MNERQLALLSCILDQISTGRELTRDLVSDCCYSTKPENSVESDNAYEAWVNVFWGGIKGIPRSELIAAKQSRKKIHDLLHRILT